MSMFQLLPNLPRSNLRSYCEYTLDLQARGLTPVDSVLDEDF